MTASRHSWRFLQTATEAVNEEAFALTGARDTCVLSAHALDHVLRGCGLRSYLLRVEAAIHRHRKCSGSCECE